MAIDATSQNSIGLSRYAGRGSRPAGERVEGVPPLVEQGAHVAVEAHRVHEDEREPVVFERRLVAAGGLPLPVGQVEQALLPEEGELPAELGSTPAKMASVPSARIRRLEGSQRREPRGSTARSHGRKVSTPSAARRRRHRARSSGTAVAATAS